MAINTKLITTSTASQTKYLGKCLGACLKSGLLIRLNGGLGSGKTCFVQGLAQGLEVPAGYDITSPTYTLVHEYPARLPMFHIDLYRLESSLDAEAIGLWEILTYNAVIAVEWAGRLDDADWPPGNLCINIKILDDQLRRIELFGYGHHINTLINDSVARYESKYPNPLK
ncbi:MAG: tRNA (adenosine(37)-N6)-threonylcarbamoyltransferase complex ATPase subunit type 1 TsaE [Desulfobacteraceae bacterium]|nr:tRNA (adenosine(37)-N6)-threonylcarbamoyltransferase complex ATPase subunit type 1 TsaE [Desulfobacteraceae bacterium]